MKYKLITQTKNVSPSCNKTYCYYNGKAKAGDIVDISYSQIRYYKDGSMYNSNNLPQGSPASNVYWEIEEVKQEKEEVKTREQLYLEMQAVCGISVGDYVKVLREAKGREYGWNNVGTKNCVGRVFQVTKIDKFGIHDTSTQYIHPFFVLEKVKPPAIEVKVPDFSHKVEIVEDSLKVGCTYLTKEQVDTIIKAWEKRNG